MAGQPRVVALEWRPIGFDERRQRMKAASTGQSPREFSARVLADCTRWYSIPSFNSDPQSPAAKALPPMIAAMRADRAALAAAPAIVLDLRGNGGGSSDWPRQIAQALWGRAALAKLPAEKDYVEWRVSRANLESVQQS